MSEQTLHIFLNGEMHLPEAFHAFHQPGDLIFAVDGGLHYVLRLGYLPDLLLGDLDSVEKTDLDAAEKQGVEMLRYPVQKDETDFELALNEAVRRSARRVRIFGGLGGRLDHTLVNLSICTAQRFEALEISFHDGGQEVFFRRKQQRIAGKAGDLLSLIPWGTPVTGVTTTNLAYPLDHETLFAEGSRGISNILLSDSASVTYESGRLLCIHQS